MKSSAKGTTKTGAKTGAKKGASAAKKIANLQDALRVASERLSLANAALAERAGCILQMQHEKEALQKKVDELSQKNVQLSEESAGADGCIAGLRARLECEEIHDRRQELNIEILLDRIEFLKRKLREHGLVCA